mmetsp:Transcript_22962/g.71850  ORF Transcript_22962/g.71850 Transcript_22962/m.71850 type:complete len:518 (+) Transcript_22962:92-1645(+)
MVGIDMRMMCIGVLIRTPIMLFITVGAMRRLGLYGIVRADALGKLDSRTEEALAQRSTVQLAGTVDGEVDSISALGRHARGAIELTDDCESAFRRTRQLVEGIQEVVITALGVAAVRSGQLTLGQLVAFKGFLGAWGDAAERIMDEFGRLVQLRSALTVYFRLLDASPSYAVAPHGSDTETRVRSAGDPLRKTQKQPQLDAGTLSIHQASVSYPTQTDVQYVTRNGGCLPSVALALNNVTLRIEPGERVVVVGRSGSGKSTLAAVMAQTIRPSTGYVELDGLPLHEFSIPCLRRRVYLLSQDARLFDRSVAENIQLHSHRAGKSLDVAMGLPTGDCSETERTRIASTAVGLECTVQQLPLGLGSRCGPGGCLLSAGDRQRVLLARAIVAEPDILILDEATSNLDATSEIAVLDAVEAALPKATIIMITHRVGACASVRHAGRRVLVMENGCLVGDGTHEELSSIAPCPRLPSSSTLSRRPSSTRAAGGGAEARPTDSRSTARATVCDAYVALLKSAK